MPEKTEHLRLRRFAETIRLETLKEFAELGFGHVGGAMSILETIAALYGGLMKIDPKRPDWKERDRFVMSKGHAGPTLYATLALLGYFPIEELKTLNKGGTNLPSHCDMHKTKGVDMTTGSLGQGISTAIGIALGQRMDGSGAYTYLAVGDGELNEGQIWEGAQFAPFQKLTNLIAFVDVNGKQLDGPTEEILDPLDIGAKFAAFGWLVKEVDGHDVAAIYDAVTEAKQSGKGPYVILLKTVKGNGCDFVAEMASNHHVQFDKEKMLAEVEKTQKRLEALGGESA
ncbi:MAG: transketolase [Oscillospiraceae bacterium]|nr:transketolase [Oscillospiraceae bacterium]